MSISGQIHLSTGDKKHMLGLAFFANASTHSVNDINIPDTKIIPIYNTWLKHRNFCNKTVLSGTKQKIK